MAKGLLTIIILLSLILPFVASAQQVITCCQMVRTITYNGVTWTKNFWVSEGITTAVGDCAPGSPIIPAASTCPTAGSTIGNCWGPEWGTVCLLNVISKITNWVTYFALAVVAVMVIIGAFQIATAAGAPEKVTTGKNYILFGVVGLIIAILSRAIPAIAARIVGAL